MLGQIPVSVRAALDARSDEPEPVRTQEDVLLVIADNAAAVKAAADKASALGLECRVVWQAVQGEAAELGREFVSVVSEMPESIDVVLGGGEATVTVRGDGRGGRNTEFSLAAALELERPGHAGLGDRQPWHGWSGCDDGTCRGHCRRGNTPASARSGVDPVDALAAER